LRLDVIMREIKKFSSVPGNLLFIGFRIDDTESNIGLGIDEITMNNQPQLQARQSSTPNRLEKLTSTRLIIRASSNNF